MIFLLSLRNMIKITLVLCFYALSTWAVSLIEGPFMKIVPFRDIGSRIINGAAAVPGQLPWQAAVHFRLPSGTYFCGGSLIDTQWILTASHCVLGSKQFNILLGVTSLTDPDQDQYITPHYIVHDLYNPITLENDIGLIRLTEAVTLTDFVTPIPLGEAVLNGGVAVTVSGWGTTSDGGTAVSDTLNYVNLTTITNSQCSSFFGAAVKTGMVCAMGDGFKSTCSGDSGDPLFTGSGISAIHVGIASFVSSKGCEKGLPSGYTRTDVYRYWIKSWTGI